jgi:hypothetical protein
MAVSVSDYAEGCSLFLAVFSAVIAAVSRCYFQSLNAETQGFRR